jgi:hypothetical protein
MCIIIIPIPYIAMPTLGSLTCGGASLGFIYRSGTSSTPSVPIGILGIPNSNFQFVWNVSSGFGVVTIHYGGNDDYRGFKILWGSTLISGSSIPFMFTYVLKGNCCLGSSGPSVYPTIVGGNPPGGSYTQWGGYPFIHISSPGCYFFMASYGKGTRFSLGYMYSPIGNSLEGMFIP